MYLINQRRYLIIKDNNNISDLIKIILIKIGYANYIFT